MLRPHSIHVLPILIFCAAVLCAPATAELNGRIQVLLMGDSTCIGSFCRMTNPAGPHLEDVMEQLLSDHGTVDVINKGSNGEYIDRLLSTKRYDQEIASLEGLDFILVRYGINDHARRADFSKQFRSDYQSLLKRLRRDHPRAQIMLMTIIPFLGQERDQAVNSIVRAVASEEKLPLIDIHARYMEELKHDANLLSYRRVKFSVVPKKFHRLVQTARYGDFVVVMDDRFDAQLREVPTWLSDRHPNLAGYEVIADETAKYLQPLIRRRRTEPSE